MKNQIKYKRVLPTCIVTKKDGKVLKMEYFIDGRPTELHRFKQRIKHLDPVKITIKNINDDTK